MKNILLVQIRNLEEIVEQEINSFRRILRNLEDINLETINVYDEGFGVRVDPSRFDAVMVGGSHHAPTDEFPSRYEVEKLIENTLQENVPFLGVCFGFELLVDVLGGKVVLDENSSCFGTEEIHLTDKGRKDVILGEMPERFLAQEAHDWLVSELPDGVVNLAYSEHVPHQAIRLSGLPAYGVQFHPELTHTDMKERLQIGMNARGEEADFHEKYTKEFNPSPDSVKVVSGFLEKVVEASVLDKK